MTDLELAVRAIEDILPDMPTKSLQKWQSILRTALLKVEKELTANSLHTCVLCFFQEWGYRNDLPVSWYWKGNVEICFRHEYAEAEKELKAIGNNINALSPPKTSAITAEGLRATMEHLPPPRPEEDNTLEELMDLL